MNMNPTMTAAMRIIIIACAGLLGLSSHLAATAQNPAGIYLSGSMNGWSENDPAWQLSLQPDLPGWAYIDLTGMPAGTTFKVVGQGRKFGMKNTRNTINRNSLHLMTNNGSYNLTAGAAGLDGVHLLVQTEGFTTDNYIGIITVTDSSENIYGVCMQSSVTPTLMTAVPGRANVVKAAADITEPWYVVRAYRLANATQTVCNYGLSGTPSMLTPTSNLSPTAAPVPVPASGTGSHEVWFDTANYAYSVDETLGAATVSGDEAPTLWYDLQGRPAATPAPGHIYIRVRGGIAEKVRL